MPSGNEVREVGERERGAAAAVLSALPGGMEEHHI